MKQDNFAPILLFVYNRLLHTKKTVKALQNNVLAVDSKLYIYCDAPKSNNHTAGVDKVRKYVKGITGFKEIVIIERSSNMGLANSIIDGVTNIINKHGKVIVLEDDLESSPYFLNYMNDSLKMYSVDNNIMSIAGYSYPIQFDDQYKYDVYSFYRCMSWGWATWKDRWVEVDWDVKDRAKFLTDTQLQNNFNRGGEDLSPMLIKQLKKGIDSWAIRWCYHHYKKNAYCLYPKKSYIRNIGFDGSGVHCGVDNEYSSIALNMARIEVGFSNTIDESIALQIQKIHKRKNIFRKIINKILGYL